MSLKSNIIKIPEGAINMEENSYCWVEDLEKAVNGFKKVLKLTSLNEIEKKQVLDSYELHFGDFKK